MCVTVSGSLCVYYYELAIRCAVIIHLYTSSLLYIKHHLQGFGMSLVIALWDASIVFGPAISGEPLKLS